jgi:alginate O-acetyltransferase complex protein AlgI
MLFNSYAFLFVFAPVVYIVYWLLPTLWTRKAWSLAASYAFYGAWSLKFAVLMLITTSVDFFTARLIADTTSPRRKRFWLVVSLCSNLGVLAVFKYYDFFATALNGLLGGRALPLIHVVLPIGISFYTFESMSYTIDVYRGRIPALRHFLDYGHFVTMFPRLVAGPIVRYADMADQLRALPRHPGWERGVSAIHFFTVGLAKKVLIADVLAANLVDPLFASAGSLQMASAWAAALAYSAQLYFDFSGYSDMAVGLGLLLGFEFPRNFAKPYAAVSVADFWRRWHISLSTWLRDYLYIPLGGSRHGSGRTALNLMITMLLGGLWHGANWTFVAWGAYHGVALGLYNVLALRGRPLPRPLSVAITFLTVVLGWVLFRSSSIHEARLVYAAMAGLSGMGASWLPGHGLILVGLALALALALAVDTYDFEPRLRTRFAVAYALTMLVCVVRVAAPSPFLYFQF